MAALASCGKTSPNPTARKRTAIGACRFASVPLLQSAFRPCHTKPLSFSCLIFLLFLRAGIVHAKNGRPFAPPIEIGSVHDEGGVGCVIEAETREIDAAFVVSGN